MKEEKIAPERAFLGTLGEMLANIKVPARIEEERRISDLIGQRLEEINCPMKAIMQIQVAIDEIFSNHAFYAYNGGEGDVSVLLHKVVDPKGVTITFVDNGIPYNPLLKEDPDVTLSAEQRKIGGLGIYIVKKLMDDIKYERRDGKNILTLRKNFQ